MSKPAVLHIITKLDLGGAQKSCLSLIYELQKNYPDFEIYLISGTNGELVNQTKQLNNVFLLDSLIWEIKPTNLLLELKNFYQIFKIISHLKIKHNHNLILHTHTIKAGTIGRWCALLAGIKIKIHTIHGFGFNIYQNKLIWLCFYLIELINSLITTHFICVSSVDLASGSEIFPGFKAKSSIIRAATLYPKHSTQIDDLNYLSNHKTKQYYTIGTIASLKTGKNLFELLKAFQFACQKTTNLRLEIIGDGPLRPALEQYLIKHQLHDKVQILGWQTNIKNYTKNWQLFIFTSLWEGLPCAIIEMITQAIPILSYQVGGISDLINQNQLFYSRKWPELASAIINLQKNKSYYNQLLNRQLQPSPDFYIPKMALDHVKLYQALLNK